MAFVQQKAEQATSSVSSFTTTAMTVGAGNSIVACMSSNAPALTSLNASDSKSDSYTNGVKTSFSANGCIAIGWAKNIAGGSTTFTVTPNSARFVSISAQEYDPLGASSEATNSGSSTGNPISPGAVNPASANDLYVSCWTHGGSGNEAFTFNVSGEGWNQRSNLTNTTNQPLGSQDLIASGSKTGSANASASVTWVAAVATFQALAAAGGGAELGATRIAHKFVGPMAQRFLFRQPTLLDTTVAAPSTPAVMPPAAGTRLVGPPALRRLLARPQPLPAVSQSGGPNIFTQALTATLDFVGALVKSTAHTGEAGALSFAGALVKRTSTARTATLSFAGGLALRTGKALTGALSFAGARAVSIAKGLTGTLSFAGSQVRAVTHGMTAALSFVGAVVKRTASARTGTLAFVGSLVTGNAFIRAFTGTLSFSGAFAKRPGKALAGTLSFSGTQSRLIAKALAGVLSFVGALTRRVSTAKTATLSFAGNLLTGQAYVRALTATLSFAGSLSTSRVTLKALTATLSFAGTVSRRTGKALTGGLSFSGTVARRVSKGVASALSFVGALTKRTARALTAALSFVGAMVGFKLGSPTIARITLSDSSVYRVSVSDAAAPSSSADRAVTGITASDQ